MEVHFLSASSHPESFGSIMKKLLKDKETDILASIMANISHIAGYGGHPAMPLAAPLRDVDGELNEIRCKWIKKYLLRIYYFVDREKERMILLNTTIKPDGRKTGSSYEGKNKKILDKKIQEDIRLAQNLKEKYPLSQNNYDQL